MIRSTPHYPSSLFASIALGLAAAFTFAGPGSPAVTPVAGQEDVAHVRLVVEATESSATGTASAARLHARRVVSALRSSGVAVDEIDVGEVEMTAVLERPRVGSSRRPEEPRRVIGYRGWVGITVTTPAVTRVDRLVDHAAGAGAVLEWVEYGESGEDPPEPTET